MNRETPRNKDGKAQEHDQGIRERSGWCSSRRVLVQLTESEGWWMGDDDSHGVEISIAGGVRKMVRHPTPRPFFFFSFFFFFSVLILCTAEAKGRSDRYKNHINLTVWQQQTSSQSDPSSRRWKPWGEPLV